MKKIKRLSVILKRRNQAKQLATPQKKTKFKQALEIARSWGLEKEYLADIRWQREKSFFGIVRPLEALQEWDLPLMTKEEWQNKEGKD